MEQPGFIDLGPRDFAEWIFLDDPDGEYADIISWGGDLSVRTLQNAYMRGIFPWPMNNLPLPWYCPRQRAVIVFSELRIPRSLAKEMRKNVFRFTLDNAFRDVITGCSRSQRADSSDTWIYPDVITAYCRLHDAGMAHSVEAWDETGSLAGGLYGVDAGGVFCGESMFYTVPNASKLALLFLIDHLKSRGSTWLDVQVMTPHMKALGAKEIDRSEFLEKLRETQKLNLKLF